MSDQPIGVFDSGLGGLTVLRALIDLLPDERIVYFGDTGRFPYGPKPADEVLSHALTRAPVAIEWSEADAPPVSVPDDSDVEAVLTH